MSSSIIQTTTARFLLIIAVFAVIVAAGYLTRAQDPQPEPYHLVKLDNNGEPMPLWAGPWFCVKDTKNRLIWEAKNNNENLHHGSWSYSWFDGETGVPDKGNCNHEDDYLCDVADLLEKTRSEQLCGIRNWRLPTAAELKTLVREQNIGYGASINQAFFPYTRQSNYWIADKGQKLTGFYQRFGEGAKVINFKDGEENTLPYSNASFVRLVSDY